MNEEEIKKFFEEIGLTKGVENIRKFQEEILNKYYIDKQKVKEAINAFENEINAPADATIPINKLKKELGLGGR